MADRISQCMGQYDFDRIARYARKRFVEGIDTITLLGDANSVVEREEIVLVSLLDVDGAEITALEISCSHASSCAVTDCHERLRQKIVRGLIPR